MRALRIVIAATLLAVTAGQSQAGIIVYTSRSSFDAAVSNQSLIDFETPAIPGDGSAYYDDSTGSTFAGATFTESGGRLFVNTPGTYSTPGTTQYLNDNFGLSIVNVAFTNGPIFAVGMDLANLFNWGGTPTPGAIQITLSNGETLSTTVASEILGTSQTMTFVGIVSDTLFSSLAIDDPSLSLMIDNVAFSARSPLVTPEPTSFALAGFAGLGMAVGAWRRRRQPAA